MKPDDFADLVVMTIKGALGGPLVAGRFNALEARVVALEARASLKFCGVHDRQTKAYVAGDVVVRSGGLWVCTVPTTGPFAHSAWKLVVKSGAANDAD